MNTEPPKPDRLAAFSDGVIAVIITIMVLDLKAPHGVSWRSLVPLWPTFLAYTLSYLFVGVFWSNHHYLLREAERADHKLVGANLFSMFTVSLIPFSTSYVAENNFASFPMALYAGILLLATFAYLLLQIAVSAQGETGEVRAGGMRFQTRDWLSGGAFLAAIPAAYLRSWISFVLLLAGVLLYLLPNALTTRE
jgi:uncharacterized membrane protein